MTTREQMNGHSLARTPSHYRGRFIILTEDMPEHPKIVDINDSAFRVWIEALCYSRLSHGDGHLSRAALERIAGRRRNAIADLIAAGLVEAEPGGYLVHDWDYYQTLEDELDQLRGKRSLAGRKGGRRSAQTRKT